MLASQRLLPQFDRTHGICVRSYSVLCLNNLNFCTFQVTGAIILGIGIWTKTSPGSYDAFLGNKGYKTSANVMLAAGSVVMVVGFLGCCGAARESRCMLGWVSQSYG